MWTSVCTLPVAMALAMSVHAGDIDLFTLELEQLVSDGVPAVGAGNLETATSQDVYTVDIPASTTAYFDEQSGLCGMYWQLVDPFGKELFEDTAMCLGDPGLFTLDEGGEYTITVFSPVGAIGGYSFIIWNVNPPEEFTIPLEHVVFRGDPGRGAGNIEEPGAIDIYTLSIDSPTDVFFDELSAGCGIRWTVNDPAGNPLISNNPLCLGDPGVHALAQTGDYTITVFGQADAVGVYSFTVWQINEPEMFSIDIGQAVSDGVPAPGAGNIEEPGAIDIYTLTVEAPTGVFFEEIAGSCGLAWTVEDPQGNTIFTDQAMCLNDPGAFSLVVPGNYIITVSGELDADGPYSFIVHQLESPDEFTIEIDELVADGVPARGAGNLESPGAIDIYALNAKAGDVVCFQELAGSCIIDWRATQPDDTILFDDPGICLTNPGKFTLEQSGAYIITVFGQGAASGTYSFIVNTGLATDLSGDCSVGAADLAALLASWGDCPVAGDCEADFDDDNAVGPADLATLLSQWG